MSSFKLVRQGAACGSGVDENFKSDIGSGLLALRLYRDGHIEDDLKARAYRELGKLGVTPSDLLRQALQYVAERRQVPFKPVLMTEDDESLTATLSERLANPQRVMVSLDDL